VRKKTRKWAPRYFYALNLGTHATRLLDTADKVHRKHGHDMRALKRMEVETLRQGAKTGRKVLYVYDSEVIDFNECEYWKARGGIYFVSCIKDGTAYEFQEKREIDQDNGLLTMATQLMKNYCEQSEHSEPNSVCRSTNWTRTYLDYQSAFDPTWPVVTALSHAVGY
jgi:hypothetical protein